VTEVFFVVLPHTLLLDLAGPAEALRLANQALARQGRPPAYALRYVGPDERATSSVGASLGNLQDLPQALPDGAWVVLMGQPSGLESGLRPEGPDLAWDRTRAWLARCVAPRLAPGAAGGLRLLTVCAGALLAADAGLLDGRRCTTHHELLDELQRLAPGSQVLANRVFVEDGPLWSSAGITAGIDLVLHLIGREAGDAIAAAVAQVMVVYTRRGPDDPAISPLRQGRNHLHPALHRVQDAVVAQPAADWGAPALAAVAHVTPRHLNRLFQRHTGLTAREYVERVRVAHAQQAVAAGAPPKQALAEAGFAGDRQWRRARARQRPSAG
jgi:transcriptional regulator GlxA family with amidase domain